MRPVYIKHKIENFFVISRIVTIHQFDFGGLFESEPESHDFWEFVFVCRGELQVRTAHGEFSLREGEYCFHRPEEYHQHAAVKEDSPVFFVVSFVCHSKAMGLFDGKRGQLPAELHYHIRSILSEGRKTFYLPDNDPDLKELCLRPEAPLGGEQMVRTHLEQLLISLARREGSPQDVSLYFSRNYVENHLVASILEYLEDNVYQTVRVGDVCTVLNYSRTYLNRLFQTQCGYTISEYFIRMKMEKAKELIREGEYNFSQISDLLQFNNPHYFSRVFHRIEGMSPREYRNGITAKTR